ncbi:MAG: AI-2E family transporter, partial [Thermoanaerobaculia bacterium]|nr:AI-2E family transporter [Thermoanaerobaculia bacterium]
LPPVSEAARAERPGWRGMLGLAAAVVVIAGLKAAATVLQPIVFALFLGVLALPLFGWMRRHRVPLTLAVTATMLAIVAVLAAFFLLLLGSLGEVREVGPDYWRELQERLSYTVEWWGAKGIAIDQFAPDGWKDPKVLVGFAGDTFLLALAFLSQATIALLTLVFLLFEFATFPGKLERAPERVRSAFTHFGNVSRQLQRFVLIKTLMSLAIGLTAGAWVAMLGIDFAVLLGLIAFGAHFIPNVGALIAAVPAMIFAFVQFDPMKALVVGLGYLVLGTVLGNLAEPALMGQRLGLSPLLVFVSLIFWGWLWGAVGMFLSVPLTMTVKILLEHAEGWSWLAGLLDSGARPGPQGSSVEGELAPAAPGGGPS